jgi:tRNA(Ile)-lysidine synthase TilS/MesJ
MDYLIDRDIFDIASKKIRFKLYHLASIASASKYILLGHHNDDFVENILSNLMKYSILHIADKMPTILETDGLNISRPLINVSKSDIYAFAHNFNVPYLKDTTDVNCNRGILRNTLLPLLQQLYLNLQNRSDNSILVTDIGEIIIYNLLTGHTILNLLDSCYISVGNNVYLKLFMEKLYIQYPEFKQNIEKHVEVITSLQHMDIAIATRQIELASVCLADQLNGIGTSSILIYNSLKDRYINTILENKKEYKYGFIINFVPNLLLLVWSEILSQIFHSRGCNMITIKNMKQLYQFIQAGKNHFCKLSNKHMVLLCDNMNLVFVDIRLVSESNIWKINTSITDEKVSTGIDIASFLSGNFTINIPVCQHSYNADQISYSRHTNVVRKILKGLIFKFVPIIHVKNTCSTCELLTLSLSYKI